MIFPGEGDWTSFWLLAPNIVIGTIRSAEWIGPEIDMGASTPTLQAVSVQAEIDNVIRGDLRTGPRLFYFFTNVLRPNVGYTTHLSWFEPGKRYVLFLREDSGVLRTMADLTEPNIVIRTGAHSVLPKPPSARLQSDPGAVVAAAALTPAPSGYDPSFALGIESTFNRIEQITAATEVAKLLRNLLKHTDKEIAERACLTLSMHFAYRDPCLQALNSSNDESIRTQARLWTLQKARNEARELRLLRTDPTALSTSRRIEDLADELELFTLDTNDGIRLEACTALRRLYPIRKHAPCDVLPGSAGANGRAIPKQR